MLIPNFSVFFEEVVFELTLRDEEAGACRRFTREGIACPEQEGSEMGRGGSKPHTGSIRVVGSHWHLSSRGDICLVFEEVAQAVWTWVAGTLRLWPCWPGQRLSPVPQRIN